MLATFHPPHPAWGLIHGSSRELAEAPKSEPGSKPVGKDNLQTLPLAEVEKELRSSPDGLTQAEAEKRLAQYGPNEIAEKKTNAILKFLSDFWGPIPWMIEAAVILSAAAGHWPDLWIILLLLLANGVVGFWEEHQAGNAIAALKATLAIKARVKRDGKWVNPAAGELVPGDAIRLRLGDIVPADARLLDGDEISVDQSALTGGPRPRRVSRATPSSPVRSSDAAKSTRWSTRRAARPILARRRNWWRRWSPSAISRRPY